MYFANIKTLAGIVFVAAALAALPETANAQSCPSDSAVIASASVASGGTASYSYTPDDTQMAHVWLDNVPGNLTMQIVDANNNIVCETPSTNTSAQTCAWQPASGEVDTVNIMQPVSQSIISAAVASVTSAVSTGNSANGIGGSMEAFNACSMIIN